MASPIASVVGTLIGSAADAPLMASSNIVSVIGGLVSKALDFIPDPQKKLELQSHAMDLQAQAAAAQLDAVTKQIQAQAQSGDKSLWKLRAFFCGSMTVLYLWNYAGCRFFHMNPWDFPAFLHVLFATIMLGLTGAPTAFSAMSDLLKSIPGIMSMPGDSQVSVLGLKVGNKS